MVLEEISDYLKENIEDFELESELALRKIDRQRAPLSHVNSELDSQIEQYMDEWLHNEISTEDLLCVQKEEHKPSVFDIINGLSQFADRVKELAETVRKEQPEAAGLLDEAHQHIGGAYVALNTYLEALK